MGEEGGGCEDKRERVGCAPQDPSPLIFLCQAGSKAEQKWRFGDGSVALNLNIRARSDGGGRESLKKQEVEKKS